MKKDPNVNLINPTFQTLPKIEELKIILASESQRKAVKIKDFGDYSAIINLCTLLKIDTKYFDFESHLELADILYEMEKLKLELNTFLNLIFENWNNCHGQEIFFENGSKINWSVDFKEELLTAFDNIYEYLTTEDKPEKADLIFVCGSTTTIRSQKAIELYEQGFAKCIMVSGHSFKRLSINNTDYQKDKEEKTEADILGEYIKQEIAFKNLEMPNIILEREAVTVPDYAKRAIDFFHKNNFYPKSILMVTSPYSMARSNISWQRFLDFECKIVRINSSFSQKFGKGRWYMDSEVRNIFINEYLKIKAEYLANILQQQPC
jgi:hypothetical protein